MALLGSFVKQPREIYVVDLHYDVAIGARPVDSIAATIETPAGMTLESSQLSGDTLQLHVGTGLHAHNYRWTVLCEIVIGGKLERLEDEFDVVVEET
jgi:hypothetical protein